MRKTHNCRWKSRLGRREEETQVARRNRSPGCPCCATTRTDDATVGFMRRSFAPLLSATLVGGTPTIFFRVTAPTLLCTGIALRMAMGSRRHVGTEHRGQRLAFFIAAATGKAGTERQNNHKNGKQHGDNSPRGATYPYITSEFHRYHDWFRDA